MDDEVEFSSFAYLIGLIRTLDIIFIGIPPSTDENVKIIIGHADASIAAWLSLLPASKRRLIRDDGTIDELLFKANVIIQA
jgi:hypothetical protein